MPETGGASVCFVAGTLGQGGAERQLYYMVRALRQNGTAVLVLSLTRAEYWERELVRLGARVIWVGQQSSRLLRLARMLAVARVHRPGILQSQHFYTNLYAVGIARALRRPEIGAIRNNVTEEVDDSGRLLGRLSLRIPRTVVANSSAAVLKALALGVPAGRLHMLPNVVDVDQFRPARRRRQGIVRVLAVGRLTPQKGFDRLLPVLGELRRRSRTPFSAVIVGDGPERARLERQAADLGLLPGCVEFRGRVGPMAAEYQSADLLAAPSRFEGTPNVVLEAMSCGLPVVATSVGGVPEVVRHGETGFLAEPDDPDRFSDWLVRLVDDESLRQEMGRRARERILSAYSTSQLPDRLAHVYRAAQPAH